MEVETGTCWRRSRTASLSLPQRGNCNRNPKTFSLGRRDVEARRPVIAPRLGFKLLFDDLFPLRQSVAPAHIEDYGRSNGLRYLASSPGCMPSPKDKG
jgi:hypothetical protein